MHGFSSGNRSSSAIKSSYVTEARALVASAAAGGTGVWARDVEANTSIVPVSSAVRIISIRFIGVLTIVWDKNIAADISRPQEYHVITAKVFGAFPRRVFR